MGRPSPSFWHRRRVFVTGCTGFLGAWVVRELLARGAVVVGLVRDRMRPSDLFDDRLFERIAVVRGRIEDRWRLESALAVHGIETVFHLAVPAVVLANSTDPTHHLAARWARTLLTAVKRSSPTAEVVIPVPAGDATGRAEVAAAFARRTGAAVGVALLPRLFGGGDRRWSRLVPWTVRAVLTGRPVEPPRSYELAESYLYVRDAARACLGLAEALAGDPEAWAGRAAPVPATATGADLFEVLTAPYLPSPFAGEGSGARDQCPVPLLDAVAETARWYRRSFHTPAAAEAVVPARFAA
ncbi:MAG TPA: NAD-dependent epimerase/dehydratase family protein [Fimbriiglobus sp.]|nr:NAD-dependent epimerase/dehydratase family protein [Fimbriiglobus sp.]